MTNLRSPLLLGLLIVALVGAGADAKKKKKLPQVPQSGWGAVITNEDRVRLREWRTAWIEGLTSARGEGFTADIAREGALLDPDAARTAPEIPDGNYRCRTIKLGRKTGFGKAFRIEPVADCYLRGGHFRVTQGVQRLNGHVWHYDGTRLIFLGAIEVSDERASIPYARDKERDAMGLLDKVGPDRWRMALPRPSWESQTDVVEITPAR